MSNELVHVTASLPDRMEYASKMSVSGLLPDVFRNQPANVMIGIALANALNMAPIIVMNELAVIGGKPSWSAKFMRALVRRAGHKLRESFADGVARCIIIRADDPDYEHVTEWDEAKARDHGYWGKGHWQKNAPLMLGNRALSECVRSACPEVLAGVSYTTDEVADFVPAARHTVEQVTPASPATPPPVSEPEPAGITREQTRKLGALMKAEGMDKAAMLTFARDITGRADLKTAADLSADEADIVIAGLEATATPPGVDADTGEVVEAEIVPDEQPAFDDAAWMAGAK